ncbi:electron transport complex subunit RsxC [Enterococcus sp. S86.2]|uniref:electron transport complex subunit RsxC n=1 Tax=Enterococcus sp. S86.2 TaxID=3031299 RepID=UPI0026EAA88F|nr:electron transport complex subunit RsxC [Enterococcus sp. S86.2]
MKIKQFSGGFFFDASTNKLKELFQVKQNNVAYFEPEKVVIPFDQHIGSPNKLIKKVGDFVTKGEIIAKSSADISGHVHTSVTGKVIAVCEVPALGGKTQTAAVIKRDPSKNTAESLISPDFSFEKAVRAAGIVGLGGATFPTHVKLNPASHIDVQTIILNGAECEPFIASDDFLMQKESRKILRGGEIAREILGAKTILVGIEKDKPKAITAMKKAAVKIPNCHVIPLPVKYPQGGEGQLLETLIAAESPLDGRSVETGAFTINVATAFAISESVDERKALTHRYVTICGDVKMPQVICFPLGTQVKDLIDYCGGFIGTPSRVIHGGPMMGKSVTDLALPLTKGSNGIIVFNEAHDGKYPESPCIRCNRCVEVCPVRLEPQNIDLAYRSGDLFTCDQLLATACINCGCCTYVCPARRNLAANITQASGEIKQEKEALADANK